MRISCTRWNCRPHKPCRLCQRTDTDARAAEHLDWFRRTGHCGLCGQPGAVCMCTDAYPCGCRDLHEMGAGIGIDRAALFAEADPAEVSDDQQELFG